MKAPVQVLQAALQFLVVGVHFVVAVLAGFVSQHLAWVR